LTSFFVLSHHQKKEKEEKIISSIEMITIAEKEKVITIDFHGFDHLPFSSQFSLIPIIYSDLINYS
jgi:hypothetical protein